MKETFKFSADVEVEIDRVKKEIHLLKPGTGSFKFDDELTYNICELISDKQPSGEEIINCIAPASFDGTASVWMYIGYLKNSGLVITEYKFVDTNYTFSVEEKGLTQFANHFETPSKNSRFKISKFAFLRMDQGSVLLETSLSPIRFRFNSTFILDLFLFFKTGKSIEDIATLQPENKNGKLDTDWLLRVIRELKRAHILIPEGLEEQDNLRVWEFHDLLFHARSREGRTVNSSYDFFRFHDSQKPIPPPQLLHHFDGKVVKLEYKNIIQSNQVFFKEILDRRSSQYPSKDKILTIGELSEFLYECNHLKSHQSMVVSDQIVWDIGRRPYPSAGALYELDIYPLIVNCEGAEPGLYYHDPVEHQLILLNEKREEYELLKERTASMLIKGEPSLQVILFISSRHGRIAWKYSTYAYALTLKNAGVLTAYMYLIAEALNLNACAIGIGNTELFSKVSGLNWFENAYIADFIIGK